MPLYLGVWFINLILKKISCSLWQCVHLVRKKLSIKWRINVINVKVNIYRYFQFFLYLFLKCIILILWDCYFFLGKKTDSDLDDDAEDEPSKNASDSEEDIDAPVVNGEADSDQDTMEPAKPKPKVSVASSATSASPPKPKNSAAPKAADGEPLCQECCRVAPTLLCTKCNFSLCDKCFPWVSCFLPVPISSSLECINQFFLLLFRFSFFFFFFF